MNHKSNIRHYSHQALEDLLQDLGEPKFRAKQLHEWLWQKGVGSFDAMTNLSKSLRENLANHYSINPVTIATEAISEDSTVKFGFKLHDGHLTEGVLIPLGDRMTACISSQVGCSLSCRFCATGSIDLKRNINYDEIYDQVVLIDARARALYNQPLTNIVFMGMGEPLLNFNNVTKAINRITSDDGLAMSPKRITVSTVGVAKMIKKLADENLRVNFALSLHVADEGKRKQIMPITETRANSIESLKEAVQYFYQQTGIRVTYEYTLLNGFNDNPEDAEALAEFCKITPCKINLIEYNTVETSPYQASTDNRTQRFREILEGKNLVVNIRNSRGEDIDAACGQLANKNEPVL